MRGKKILMLGGSAQQVPIIEKAREMGLYTVVVDYLPDNPGRLVADKWYPDSTVDIPAVERIAREEKVDAILCYASDPAAWPAAVIADRLGLPGNPPESVRILSHKHLFRRFQRDNSFPSPQSISIECGDSARFNPECRDAPWCVRQSESGASPTYTCREPQLAEMRFPVMVKPVDSSGSKGVLRIENIADLDAAIEKAAKKSRSRRVVIEEIIPRGWPGITDGEVLIADGRVILDAENESLRLPDISGGNLPCGNIFPSSAPEEGLRRLTADLQRLVDLLGIRFGEFNVEAVFTPDNTPVIVDIGARAGGNMTPILISDALGIDLLEINIRLALGESINLPPRLSSLAPRPSSLYFGQILFSRESGSLNLDSFRPSSLVPRPSPYRQVLYRDPADPVAPFRDASDALGISFLRFPSRAALDKFLISNF